jgi:ribonucleoside-diphosphate reductase alpha chain
VSDEDLRGTDAIGRRSTQDEVPDFNGEEVIAERVVEAGGVSPSGGMHIEALAPVSGSGGMVAQVTQVTRVTQGTAIAVRPVASKIEEARMKGFEGDACHNCFQFTLVRNGTCLKCTQLTLQPKRIRFSLSLPRCASSEGGSFVRFLPPVAWVVDAT